MNQLSEKSGPRVAILSYHKIGPPPPGGWETWYYISTQLFQRQLQMLQDRGYVFLDLPTFYRGLDDPASLPAKSTLITFDDGYRNNLTAALPVMMKFGAPGVVFVPTNYIGGMNLWDAGGQEPDEAICDWDDLRKLERFGLAIESHSVTHPAFSNLTPEEHEAELRKSKEALEAGLGRKVEFFSYPYGDSGTDPALAEELAKKVGYRAACLYGGDVVNLANANRYRLERLALGMDSDLGALLGEGS
jgi:peptidoglycan/xylan/chitin deacetylase (PgdA/CDA1 family)